MRNCAYAVADHVINGKIVGWYQGRMEFVLVHSAIGP